MAEPRELLSKGKTKKVEKVENRGTFRIVGQVFQDASSKTALGYGIIDVKNCQLRLFTKKQTVELMLRYKFENAEIDANGKIVNTECSMDRLIKFDTNKNIIGNAGITILGQVILNGKDFGYRVLNPQGKVVDITEDTLLCISKNGEGTPILNAKVIKEGVAKPYVSAIKGDFKRIEIADFEEMKNVLDGKSVKKAHDKFLEKQKANFARKLAFHGFIRLTSSPSAKKATKILLSEYVIPTYPFLNKDSGLSVSEALTLAYLVEVSDGTFSKYNVKFSDYSKKVGKERSEFVRFSTNILRVAKANGYDDVVEAMLIVNSIVEGNLRCISNDDKVLKNNEGLRKYVEMFINTKVSKNANVERETYNPAELDYESVKGIEILGYTINKSKVGDEFKSILYTKPKNLRWALEDIDRLPCDSDFILDNINCFGDLELMRKIIKNYELFLHPSYGTSEEYKLKAEAYLFVLACNNVALADYVNAMCSKFSELPLEEINREKFNLDSNDKLFYLSGGKFNRSITLKAGESWSNPSDGKGALSNFTGGYFAAMSLYMTIDGQQERGLIE